MNQTVRFLLYILFVCAIHCKVQHHKPDPQWFIQSTNKAIPSERESLFDCPSMGVLCSHQSCEPFAKEVESLPTEYIFNSQDQFTGLEHGNLKLLCVSPAFLRIAKPMSAIVQFEGILFWAELRQEKGKWHVSILHNSDQSSFEIEKVKRDRSAPNAGCVQAEIVCNRNLKSCIQDTLYPYLQVREHMEKFDKIADCADKGRIEGFQCKKVMCTPEGGKDKPQGFGVSIPAILQCQSGYKAHEIFWHKLKGKDEGKDKGRWCLSKYDKQSKGEDSTTLEDTLRNQAEKDSEVDAKLKEKLVAEVLNKYDHKVQSYWFWGDAADAMLSILPTEYRSEMRLNIHQSFTHLMDGNQKEIFGKMRNCQFRGKETEGKAKSKKKVGDKITFNCDTMTVTPWDILQFAVNAGKLKSAQTTNENVQTNSATKPADVVNKEVEKAEEKNAKKEAKAEAKDEKAAPKLDPVEAQKKKAEELKTEAQENKSNKYLTMTLAMIIPIVLLLMSGVYIFYI